MNYQLKSPPCIAELVDAEYVVINLDSGKYYNMVGLGAEIFKLLTEGVASSKILASKANDPKFIEAFDKFVALALSEDLLKASDTPSSSEDQIPMIIDSSEIETLAINVYTDMQELLGLDPIHEVDPAAGWPHQNKP